MCIVSFLAIYSEVNRPMTAPSCVYALNVKVIAYYLKVLPLLS